MPDLTLREFIEAMRDRQGMDSEIDNEEWDRLLGWADGVLQMRDDLQRWIAWLNEPCFEERK